VAGLGLAAGALGVALGVDAVKRAIAFEKQMANVSTLLADGQKVTDEFKDSVRDLIRTLPVKPEDVGAGIYDVLSAGITDSAKALQVLRDSAELGVAGLGSTSEAVDIMTSALNAFSAQGLESRDVANILFQTTAVGKTTVAELAQSFGNVAAIVATAGVEFADFQAATAALTTAGLSASVAQNQLRAAVTALIAPSQQMKDIYSELGVKDFTQLLEKTGSLGGAFVALSGAVGGNQESLAKAFGSVEALNAALSLGGEQNAIYKASLDNMRGGVDQLTGAVAKQTETFDAQWQMLKNNFNVTLEESASGSVPSMTSAMVSLNATLTENKDLIQGVIGVITLWISSAIELLILSLKIVIEYLRFFWGSVWDILQLIYKAIVAFIDFGKKLLDFRNNLKAVGEGIKSFINDPLGTTKAILEDLLSLIGRVASALKGLAGTIVGNAKASAGRLGFASGGIVPEYYADGGFARRGTDTVPAMLTPGELILNKAQQRNLANGMGGITVNITGTFLSEDAAERVGDMIVQRFQRHTLI
jgi:TP901 family phage tail tape measure protein